MPTTIAIAGATGKLGRLITNHVLAREDARVHAIVRSPEKIPAELQADPRVIVFKADATNVDHLREAVRGADVVVCSYLGTPEFEFEAQRALIDASIAESVPRYLASDFTLDFRLLNKDELPQKMANKLVCDYLQERRHQIKSVHVLIGSFIETMFSAGYFSTDQTKDVCLSHWGTGDEVWEMTSYDTAAQYTAAVAMDKEAVGWFEFLGDRITLKEMAQVLGYVFDRHVSIKSRGSMAELEQKVKDGAATDVDAADLSAIRAEAYALYLTDNKTTLKTHLDNGKYPGIRPQTFTDWVRGKQFETLSKTAVC